MPLTIPDELLEKAGLTESEARIEFACRLFQAGKITLPVASRIAGLSRVELEEALSQRNIPAYRITLEDYEQDMASLKKLGF